MKVLVTGANGFLGSHIVERLVAHGHEARAFVRATSDLSFLEGASYETALGDVRDASSLRQACAGIDAVVHAAGLTSARNEDEYRAVNEFGTKAVLEAAAAAGVRRFVYISSLAARGPNAADGSEPASPSPVSSYGRSKLAGESAVLAAHRDMSVVALRPPVIYGPRDRALLPFYKIVRLGVMPLYGDGRRRLSWIHVRDCADAAVRAAEAEASGRAYALSDGGDYTWNDLVDMLAAVLGKRPLRVNVPGVLYAGAGHAAAGLSMLIRRPLPLTPEKVVEMSQPGWVCGNERITADLGWTPAIDPKAGIEETARWYRDHRWI